MKVMLDAWAYKPTRGHSTDAGLDLRADVDALIQAHGHAIFHTGVHVQLPQGTCGIIMSKSGLNVNHDITSTGLIDEGYTGEIVLKLYNHGDTPYEVRRGDKISQLVVLPCVCEELEFVDRLDSSERGDNGFGSTGK